MKPRVTALEMESTISRRQAAVRRTQLENIASDRTMTPVTFVPIGLGMGSVGAHDVTSTRNFFSRVDECGC
jgi:hypothetical protein